ncbi:hypothetical protein CASFOL_009247 [Castilleja foliolosa]|uniref:PGG domain-containing protein n=1 Tax=Castilleja foliolosa TaxID=1961234 RepID=A0ABD3DWP9_9LAMI
MEGAISQQMKRQLTGKRDDSSLHSAARAGNLEVILEIINEKEEEGLKELVSKQNQSGETALYVAAECGHVNLVEEFVKYYDVASAAIKVKNGFDAFHIAAKLGQLATIIHTLLKHKAINKEAINKSGETAFDTSEKTGRSEITAILREYGVKSTKCLNSQPQPTGARELKQTGQYVDEPKDVHPGITLGEANIAPNIEFTIFLIFDSLALFISLAVVVVQTSVVVVERQANKQLMTVINKLMWLACAFVLIAYLALCYIIVGKKEKWLAIGVTFIGTLIMATTLGTLCYWVVMHRIEASNWRSLRKSARNSRSLSSSISVVVSDSDIPEDEYRNLYALY